MNRYTTQEKSRMVVEYLLAKKSTAIANRSLRTLWSNPRLKIDHTTFERLLGNFLESGMVSKKRTGNKTSRTPENINRVSAMIELASENRTPTSTRRLASQVGMSHMTLLRMLRQDLKLKPYHIKLIHKLNEDDFDRRIEFSEILLDRQRCDESFLDKIVWSDEAWFTLSGTVNRHNCVYWDKENPNITKTIDGIGSEKVMVWAGFSASHKIGLFFINRTLNGETYRSFLVEMVIPAMLHIREDFGEHFIFQQDGAPPHFSRNVRNLLDDTFNEWIGRRGTIDWPARSPDLTPCDFFLWGYLKDKVYSRDPSTLVEMKEFIVDEFGKIPQDMISKACSDGVQKRAEICCFLDGKQLKLHKNTS